MIPLIIHPLRRATDRRPVLVGAERPTVSLVIPVSNGIRELDWLLEEIPGCVQEVVLVGDRIELPTFPSTRSAAPLVRTVPRPPTGEGSVFHDGIRATTGEYIVLIDADGSMSPKEIPHYLHYLECGYDFVKGSRFIAGGDSAGYPMARRLGHRALLLLARGLYKQHLTDVWYGFCAFRRGFLELLPLRSGTVELGAEFVVHAMHYGLRIAEVPSAEQPRRHGTDRLRTVHDGGKILRILLDERPRNGLARLGNQFGRRV